MPPPPATLYTAAHDVLAAVVAFYVTEGIALPDRQYVSDGPNVAWDCEQCVVFTDSTFAGLSDLDQPLAIDCPGIRSARMAVEIARCSPILEDADFPTMAEIDASAAVALADATLLPYALRVAQGNGDIAGCHNMTIDAWQGLGPAGGFVGGRLTFALQLDNI